jgi:hypothetical protein
MKPTVPPLRVAKPCPKNWNDMQGDDKRRFCEHCQLHVHNLSAMAERERDALIEQSGGHLCIAYLERADGTMVTPSRWRRWQKQFVPLKWAASLAAALLPFWFSGCEARRTMGSIKKSDDKPHNKTARPDGDGRMMLGEPIMPAQKAKDHEH